MCPHMESTGNQVSGLGGSFIGSEQTRDAREDSTRAILSAKCQREHSRRLHRICKCIEGRVQRGQKLRKAVRWFSFYWRERRYKANPERKVPACPATLLRAYYRWKEGGRCPEAVAYRYQSPVKRVTPMEVRRLLGLCVSEDVDSLAAGFRMLHNAVRTHHAYRHAMTQGQRKFVNALLYHRRTVKRLIKQWRKDKVR